jgi:hypothetical protein
MIPYVVAIPSYQRPSPGSADRRGSWANPTPIPEA